MMLLLLLLINPGDKNGEFIGLLGLPGCSLQLQRGLRCRPAAPFTLRNTMSMLLQLLPLLLPL